LSPSIACKAPEGQAHVYFLLSTVFPRPGGVDARQGIRTVNATFEDRDQKGSIGNFRACTMKSVKAAVYKESSFIHSQMAKRT